jgi:hypothetical protein
MALLPNGGSGAGGKGDPFGQAHRENGEFSDKLLADLEANYVPPQFTEGEAAQVLHHVGWDLEVFEKRFKDEPVALLKEAKVARSAAQLKEMFLFAEKEALPSVVPRDAMLTCPICMDEFPASPPPSASEWTPLPDHDHATCRECLSMHILDSVTNHRAGVAIRCPYQGCPFFIPSSVVLDHVDAATAEKLRQNDRDAFVFSATDFKYCPATACSCVIGIKTPLEYVSEGKARENGRSPPFAPLPFFAASLAQVHPPLGLRLPAPRPRGVHAGKGGRGRRSAEDPRRGC